MKKYPLPPPQLLQVGDFIKKYPLPPPQLLQVGDFVFDSGADAFASVTRTVTGPKCTPWWRRARDISIATHVGNVCDFAGQKLITEMRPNGLEPNAPGFYRTPFSIKPRRPIAVLRLPLSATARSELNRQMALDIRRGFEYSVKDLVRFVIARVDEQSKRMYCSEYSYQLFVNANGEYNHGLPYDPNLKCRDFDNMVSPYALMYNLIPRCQVVWKPS